MAKFNQGVRGHEAGTSPEHAAAHPHSDEQVVGSRGNSKRR